MESFLQSIRQASQYYVGYPRKFSDGPVISFTSEKEFVELLQSGSPVVVAFTVTCAHTRHLDMVLKQVAAEWSPSVKVLRVECPKHPGFCISRQRQDYPFIEVFQNSQVSGTEQVRGGRSGSVTRYRVNVLPFNYDQSVYGFREFLERLGVEPPHK